MQEYNEIIKDLNECIKTINNRFIQEDKVDSAIAFIQVKCAVNLAQSLDEIAMDSFSPNKINNIELYLNMCSNCLMIYDDLVKLEKIDELLEGSDFISSEVINYILVLLKHMAIILERIIHNMQFCKKLLPFSESVVAKFNEYNGKIRKILDNDKIK